MAGQFGHLLRLDIGRFPVEGQRLPQGMVAEQAVEAAGMFCRDPEPGIDLREIRGVQMRAPGPEGRRRDLPGMRLRQSGEGLEMGRGEGELRRPEGRQPGDPMGARLGVARAARGGRCEALGALLVVAGDQPGRDADAVIVGFGIGEEAPGH
jgi:hypothetical protein